MSNVRVMNLDPVVRRLEEFCQVHLVPLCEVTYHWVNPTGVQRMFTMTVCAQCCEASSAGA